VLGSGIAGLTAAAALARRGQKVLVLEQHRVAGGLTQTFTRQDWTFSTGVHYLGGLAPVPGPEGAFGRLLHWLGGGALQFEDCGNPYDIVRLPGFEFGIEHPEEAYRAALLVRFPDHGDAIEQWFAEMHGARRAAFALLATRGMPTWLAWALRLWRGSDMQHFAERSLASALAPIGDPRLRAVLGARWGDYGATPVHAPLLEHALVTGSYNGGAYYPVGGPARFAQVLGPVIEGAGGELRLGADVRRIELVGGRAGAVVFDHDGRRYTEHAQHVISAMGVTNTVACLDEDVTPEWRGQVRALQPGLSVLALYLGLDGDIRAAGASAANVWIYESDDLGRLWQRPADEDAPSLFVSFPSLKDPAHAGKPTAEVLAFCDASAFAPWIDLPADERPEEYLAFKAWVEERLLAQFTRHFPALGAMVRLHELSTPLTQKHFVRSPAGAAYGLEMSAHRLESPALNVRTPVPGLLLAGQDVSGAGVQAACMSGLMAAAVIEPALLRQLGA
jgi:all-trans-retinol 13,14-reductase